jgi:hypothetical protein
MTPAEFKRKWARYSGKETAAYQEHFNDLCALLGQPSPAAADPTGNESFCFQKRVVKDAELFALDDSGRVAEEPNADRERGFADVWKKGCFAWEYKGKKKNLDAAYQQLLRYRESLLNPPLLVVCDFDRYVVRTNFNGTVQETHEFTNANIDSPPVLHLLRAVFIEPEFLKPQRTTAEVTEKLAGQIAAVARSLQERESIELADAKTRREHAVAQRKNLRIARFLNRIVFCFFAEDTGLLPANLVTEIFKGGVNDPEHFSETLEELFATMATGGGFGRDRIRHFNGHLFEEATVFQLDEKEIGALATAGEADWQFIQPSIMGNLFERGLDPNQRAQIGAHYTSEEDILTIVEPVLMAPLRREWSALKSSLASAYAKAKGSSADRAKLTAFHSKMASVTVLDPACGSGNFLYVALKLLLDLEKELIAFATQLGFTFKPRVNVQQLKAIEINSYAFELAQVAVQIGYLQWRRDNGFQNDEEPVLQVLDSFENKDALVKEIFRKAPKDLREARAEEHIVPLGSDQVEIASASDELRAASKNKKRKTTGEVRVYHERGWPGAGDWPLATGQIMPGLLRAYQQAVPGVRVKLHDWPVEKNIAGVRDGRLQLAIIIPPLKANVLEDLRFEQLFTARVCLAVSSNHPFARRQSVSLADAARQSFIALTREEYPRHQEYLDAIFARVPHKPRIVEEHDGWSGVFSAVDAGTGVAIASDAFSYSFNDRVKLLRLTPEPKRVAIGILTRKGKLSPAAEKFCQCAKEVFGATR